MHMLHSTHNPTPHPSGNASVSSLVSSSTSSAVSSILPRADPSVSSQSDVTSDSISLSSLPSPLQPLRGPYHDHSMGQTHSAGSSPPLPFSPPPTPASPIYKTSVLGQAAAATGSKLKRAFGGRRKKSEAFSHQFLFSNTPKSSHQDSPSRSPSPSILHHSHSSPVSSLSSSSRSTLSKLHFGRKPSPTSLPSSEPPVPPLKLLSPKKSVDKPLPVLAQPHDPYDNSHNSIIPVTPGMTSALDYIRLNEQEQSITTSLPLSDLPTVDTARSDAVASAPQKELWRKSDSTMSHRTVRPGAGGNRTPRPVSMAESLQSNHTVVPMNKRISALISDADFAPPEEADSSPPERAPATPRRAFSSSSLKSNNRLSSSLTFGARLSATKSHSQPLSRKEHKASPSLQTPPMTPPKSAQLTRTDANGIIAPSSSGPHSTGSNIRGRLAAWTNPSPVSRRPSQSSRHAPMPPQITPATPQPSFRNTAISITSSFSPAAGFAKRAVERMGKAWGGMHTSHSSHSLSASGAPSAFPGGADLGRVSSRQSRQSSVSPVPSKSKRRTPNAPSGAWSISSSTTSSSRSTSESDMFAAGPSLKTCLRGPLDSSGLVFGKPLLMGVRAAGPTPRLPGRPIPLVISSRPELCRLEERKLPALVVRCAQHLMVWGMQEEGLFRVNGRPYHISKLRAEFDTGADYELVECDLGDVDPHAVASIFKAYLRELPEPILTRTLSPFFEAAIQAEHADNADLDTCQTSAEPLTRGPSLPPNPRDNGDLPLRKPPSLSTLAMPNLSSLRPPSRKLLGTLATLIDKLPEENRDLLLTITELIKATANGSKETRMPLSNLLLVFCPSLNMNPPLLRVLCEGQGIWDGPPVFDIKRESVVLDIRDDTASSDRDDQSIRLPSLVGDSASSSSSFVNVSLRSPSEASVDSWPGPERLIPGALPDSSSESLSAPSKADQAKVNFPIIGPDSPKRPSPAPSRRLRPKPDNLVQFPAYGQPAAPVLTTRKSLTSLSLPSFGLKSSVDQNSPEPVSPSSPRDKLRHRPSFQYLRSKRSSAALKSAISSPIIPALSKSRSDSLDSSPTSSTHSYTLPSIEHSSWTLDIENHRPQTSESRQDPSTFPSPTAFGGTPSADIYRTPSGSLSSLDKTEIACAPAMQRSDSASSDDTFCSLPSSPVESFLDSQADADWTRNVLLAADMNALGRDS